MDIVLTTADGTLDDRVQEILGSPQAEVHVSTRLPPVVIGTEEGIQIQVGAVDARLETPGGRFGSRLEFEISAWVDLSADLKSGLLHLEQRDVETRIVLHDHDWTLPESVIIASISKSIDLEARIDQALKNVLIEIPDIPLFTIEAAGIDRAPDGGYSRASIRLRPKP